MLYGTAWSEDSRDIFWTYSSVFRVEYSQLFSFWEGTTGDKKNTCSRRRELD